MGVLTKEDYERRQRNVDRRNADNADILEEQGFDEEQISALEELCSIRHELHTFGVDVLWNIEHTDHDKYFYWLFGDGRSIYEMLNNAGFDNELRFKVDALPSSQDDEFMEIEDFDKYYEESVEVISDFLDDVNQKIEEWLRDFDEKHGTHYAPTGAQRIY